MPVRPRADVELCCPVRGESVGGVVAMLRVGVLGPIEVSFDQRPVRLGPKLVELLSVLLVEAGSAVPAERIVELLWGDPAPEGARATLRSHVSHLRRALPPADATAGPVLVTVGGGAGVAYRLDLPFDAVDADRFERRVAEALRLLAADETDLVERAAVLLSEALALWRGPAFADLARRPFVLARTARLDTVRRSARRAHGAALLTLGQPAEALGGLTTLLAEDPYDEAARELLATALYADHRVDQAAEVCRAGLRLLHDRGLDAPRLEELQRDILRRRLPAPAFSAREPKPVVPALLPPDPPRLVGRSAELARATRLLADAAERPVTLLVSGPAGVGKTCFALRLAHSVVAAFPDGQLHIDLRGFGPDAVAVEPGEAVRGFLDALGVPSARIPATLEAQTARYRSLLAGRRILVVLDNIADVDQVRPLLPGTPGCAVVAVSRNRLAGLVVADGAEQIRLDLLDAADARLLLARRLGADRLVGQSRAVDDIVASCARLPLALAVVAARASTHPDAPLRVFAEELRIGRDRPDLDAFDGGDPGTDVRAVLSWSRRRLSGPAGRLFPLLGLPAEAEISVAAAASLAGQPVLRVRPALRELVSAHLVTEPRPGRHGCHDLLRAYAGELGPARGTAERRAALRRLLDHHLHTALAADRTLWPTRDPLSLPAPAQGATVLGFTDRQAALRWWQEEHAGLRSRLEQAVQEGFDDQAWALSWAAMNFLTRQGHWHDLLHVGRIGAQAATRTGDPVAMAKTCRELGGAYVRLRRFDEARAEYVRTLALCRDLGDLVGEGFTWRCLGWLAEEQGELAEALRHDQRALALLRRAGHERGVSYALNSVGWCHAQLGAYEEAVRHCREALERLQRAGDRIGEASVWDSLGSAYQHIDPRRAVDCHQQALALFVALGDRIQEAYSLRRLGAAQLAAGDPDAAVDSWRRAYGVFAAVEHPEAGRLAALLARHGQPETAPTADGHRAVPVE
ncbi:BTAD domain-containing putative transcriptional regulator [Micromonospora sp. WMMD882]|uniref:AfsR/SARP family transcriptional regulator n=1 Tax=Micromonospora sp. WMMD882 TaxID=3015151 RepID=UPI00248BE563|nr:BTAD domain-containing putative transcriptional regulator [Micromonospora sp. WMMD882]WBB80254.1 BTAD domain-containing putative transcriptional regulator [Micromonospora sp. WMMD882]